VYRDRGRARFFHQFIEADATRGRQCLRRR
jgi:hypothetical protein